MSVTSEPTLMTNLLLVKSNEPTEDIVETVTVVNTNGSESRNELLAVIGVRCQNVCGY